MKAFDCIKANGYFLDGNHQAAFEAYFRGAVEHHDPRAAFNLAFMYYHGYHTPRNYVWARKYYYAASNLAGGEAQYNLALMCLRGQGEPADFRRAYRLMEASARRGCVYAQMYLGVAYTTGCMFDPIDIECVSLLPFPRLIKRSRSDVYLAGQGADPRLEDERYEVIEASEHDALEMFSLAAEQEDDTYVEEQIGSAKFLVGQAMVEGFGERYDPEEGYRRIEQAAVEHGNREAMQYIVSNQAAANIYGINTKRVAYLLEAEH